MRKSFSPRNHDEVLNVKQTLETTMYDIKEWMNQVRLKMNDAKSEFIIFSSPKLSISSSLDAINVNGTIVQRSDVVRLLGAWLDTELNMKQHVKIKSKTASLNLQRLKRIQPFLTESATKTLVVSLVLSHLDYGNALLMGLPKKTIEPLQKVQNMAAKLVLRKGKFASNNESLRSLHWLPIRARVKFKVLVTTHKCIYGIAPLYLKDLLKFKKVQRSGLRSNDEKCKLNVPRTKRKTFASRSFSVEAPRLWNCLPQTLRLQENHYQFRKELKTLLFNHPDL